MPSARTVTELHRAAAEARRLLYEPRLPARAGLLWRSPCPVEVLVRVGHVIGVDAATHPELMWLADAALTPELPIGWALDEERGFYYNTLCPTAAWEHPQLAFLAGVADKLTAPLPSE